MGIVMFLNSIVMVHVVIIIVYMVSIVMHYEQCCPLCWFIWVL